MAEPPDESRHEDGAAEKSSDDAPLEGWERAVAGVLGVLLAGAGSVAVFLTTNQAGSVALLLAGAFFLAMLVSGTPVLHARHGESEIWMARRRRRAVERVVDAPPDEADRALAALAVADPASRRDPVFRAASATVYERRLLEALAGLFPDRDGRELRTGGDFLWRFPEGDVVVEAKVGDDDAVMTVSELREMVRRAAAVAVPGALLVVTNRRLPQSVQLARRVRELSSELGRRVACVRWTDEQDGNAVIAAVNHLRRELKSQGDRTTR